MRKNFLIGIKVGILIKLYILMELKCKVFLLNKKFLYCDVFL